jgi:hypothetical protein
MVSTVPEAVTKYVPQIHALLILLSVLFSQKNTGSHGFCYIPHRVHHHRPHPQAFYEAQILMYQTKKNQALPLMKKKELPSESQYIHMINTTIVKTHVNRTPFTNFEHTTT